jgi:hypothetical protein
LSFWSFNVGDQPPTKEADWNNWLGVAKKQPKHDAQNKHDKQTRENALAPHRDNRCSVGGIWRQLAQSTLFLAGRRDAEQDKNGEQQPEHAADKYLR